MVSLYIFGRVPTFLCPFTGSVHGDSTQTHSAYLSRVYGTPWADSPPLGSPGSSRWNLGSTPWQQRPRWSKPAGSPAMTWRPVSIICRLILVGFICRSLSLYIYEYKYIYTWIYKYIYTHMNIIYIYTLYWIVRDSQLMDNHYSQYIG